MFFNTNKIIIFSVSFQMKNFNISLLVYLFHVGSNCTNSFYSKVTFVTFLYLTSGYVCVQFFQAFCFVVTHATFEVTTVRWCNETVGSFSAAKSQSSHLNVAYLTVWQVLRCIFIFLSLSSVRSQNLSHLDISQF